MRCSSDVLKKTSPLDVFGDVSEKVKHLTNDAFNDVSPPALDLGGLNYFAGPVFVQNLDCDFFCAPLFHDGWPF